MPRSIRREQTVFYFPRVWYFHPGPRRRGDRHMVFCHDLQPSCRPSVFPDLATNHLSCAPFGEKSSRIINRLCGKSRGIYLSDALASHVRLLLALRVHASGGPFWSFLTPLFPVFPRRLKWRKPATSRSRRLTIPIWGLCNRVGFTRSFSVLTPLNMLPTLGSLTRRILKRPVSIVR